jgi:hypothetical protein
MPPRHGAEAQRDDIASIACVRQSMPRAFTPSVTLM